MSYSPLTDQDRSEMLKTIGVKSAGELFCCVPGKCALGAAPALPAPLGEPEIMEEMEKAAAKNRNTKETLSFLGAGSYRHFIPAVVKHLTGRSEFYTAYTPYQAEMSQGMLQAIYEYQSLVCQLTGMDAANASLYDGATALAEAASLAIHATERKKILVARTVNPNYREVLKTYAKAADWELEEIPFDLKTGTTDLAALDKELDGSVAGVIFQQPNFFGCLEPLADKTENKESALAKKIHGAGTLLMVSSDPVSLGLLTPPGEYGADVATGEGQALGNAQNFGGPGLGLFAVNNKFLRLMPGRIVGQTEDHEGRRGFVLTLQAREQHIRREKAFSNICSNEALVALAAAIYLSTLGKLGLKKVAELTLRNAHELKLALEKGSLGKSAKAVAPIFKGAFSAPFFQEFVVRASISPEQLNETLRGENIIGGLALENLYPELKDCWLLCVNELSKKEDAARLLSALS